MALANYADLQAATLDWMTRAGQSGQVADWITLAEARLNRELGAVETDATILGVVDSRRIDIATLAMVQPIALFRAEVGCDEVFVTPKADGTFPYRADSGRPTIWAVDGDAIDFDCPLDAAYPFRLRYRQKFSLAASSTNWLLTNHPDVYLAATLMWGAGYNEDWSNGSVWKGILDADIPRIRSTIAQSKRALSSVDPALSMVGRSLRRGWDGSNG